MEIKGRIKSMSAPVMKTKKDGTGNYVIMDVDVQIGVYGSKTYNWSTHQEEETQKADMIRKSYFGEDIEPTQKLLQVDDVVTVRMHHYINGYGRVETVIESIMPANAKAKAEAQKEQPKPQPTTGDVLPF